MIDVHTHLLPGIDDGARTPEEAAKLLAAMEPGDAAEVRALLAYPPQSAGRLMTDKFVRVRPDMTTGEVIAFLRLIDPEIEALSDLYVLDAERHLLGVVSLRQVVKSVALSWSSASTSSTSRPAWSRSTARLVATVVLPLPPLIPPTV